MDFRLFKNDPLRRKLQAQGEIEKYGEYSYIINIVN